MTFLHERNPLQKPYTDAMADLQGERSRSGQL